MSIVIGRPDRGTHTHIYDTEDPTRSLCTRAPYTAAYRDFNPDDVTCPRCKRAYIFMQKIGQQNIDRLDNKLMAIVKKKRQASKNTKLKPVRSSSSALLRKKNSRTSKPVSKKKS